MSSPPRNRRHCVWVESEGRKLFKGRPRRSIEGTPQGMDRKYITMQRCCLWARRRQAASPGEAVWPRVLCTPHRQSYTGS